VRIGCHGLGRDIGQSWQALRFQQARGSTLCQDSGRVQTAVVSRPWPSQEGIAALHLSAVGAQTPRATLAKPACGILGRVQRLHQKDSGSALAITCGFTDRSG
jgi:hypothetical protein